MKIANIVHSDELVNHTPVDYINYYNESKKLEDIDSSLPTLYVGWTFMKDSNPDNEFIQNSDILKHKIIGNELYWEFSFSESKASHIKGVESFVNHVPEFFFRRYQYTNLDPVFFQLRDIQDLLDVLPNEIDAVLDYKGEMFYLLKDNKIWGLDAQMYHFFIFDTAIIWNKLVDRTKYQKIADGNGIMYQEQYKLFPNFSLLKRYLIVLLTK